MSKVIEIKIKYWETEEDRDNGTPVYESCESLNLSDLTLDILRNSAEKAKKLFEKNNYSAVESVAYYKNENKENDSKLIYHISDNDEDNPYIDNYCVNTFHELKKLL